MRFRVAICSPPVASRTPGPPDASHRSRVPGSAGRGDGRWWSAAVWTGVMNDDGSWCPGEGEVCGGCAGQPLGLMTISPRRRSPRASSRAAPDRWSSSRSPRSKAWSAAGTHDRAVDVAVGNRNAACGQTADTAYTAPVRSRKTATCRPSTPNAGLPRLYLVDRSEAVSAHRRLGASRRDRLGRSSDLHRGQDLQRQVGAEGPGSGRGGTLLPMGRGSHHRRLDLFVEFGGDAEASSTMISRSFSTPTRGTKS